MVEPRIGRSDIGHLSASEKPRAAFAIDMPQRAMAGRVGLGVKPWARGDHAISRGQRASAAHDEREGDPIAPRERERSWSPDHLGSNAIQGQAAPPAERRTLAVRLAWRRA